MQVVYASMRIKIASACPRDTYPFSSTNKGIIIRDFEGAEGAL